MDTIKLFVDAYFHQEGNMKKQRYPSSAEEYDLHSTSPKMNQKANHLKIPEHTIEETFNKEFDFVIDLNNEQYKENLQLVVQQFDTPYTIKCNDVIKTPVTDFHQGSTLSKACNSSPTFKIPLEPVKKRTKDASRINEIKGSKCKSSKKDQVSKEQIKESLMQTYVENESSKNISLLDFKYSWDIQSFAGFCTVDHAEISDQQNSPRNRKPGFRKKSGNVSQSIYDTGLIQAKAATFEDKLQIDYTNSLLIDSKKLNSFISTRLDTLESHVIYFFNVLNAVPLWSTSLPTIIRHLAKRRNFKVCDYLAKRYNSEKRRSLSEFRERFIRILQSTGFTMIDVLDDVRYALSDDSVCVGLSIVYKITRFWDSVSDDYTELRVEFNNTREDYLNYNDVCLSMDEHFDNARDIFFAFHEGVIDLFESL